MLLADRRGKDGKGSNSQIGAYSTASMIRGMVTCFRLELGPRSSPMVRRGARPSSAHIWREARPADGFGFVAAVSRVHKPRSLMADDRDGRVSRPGGVFVGHGARKEGVEERAVAGRPPTAENGGEFEGREPRPGVPIVFVRKDENRESNLA